MGNSISLFAKIIFFTLSFLFVCTSYSYEPLNLEGDNYAINYAKPTFSIATGETTIIRPIDNEDWFNQISTSANKFMNSKESFQSQNLIIKVMISSNGSYEALTIKSDKNDESLERHIKTLIQELAKKNIYPRMYSPHKDPTTLSWSLKLEKTRP